jgi:DNA polymerase-3 subunit epsilon
MRQIILDTETTGLDPAHGHRVIEIGCVEIVNRRFTGNNLHHYLDPERDSDEAALEVHGLTREFLTGKAKFAEISGELLGFVKDAQIIIHNAPFDLGFLDAELARLKLPSFRSHVGSVVDSLVMAKEAHPGKRNNLDALCDRYGISNAHRTLHGALLDSTLLAEVYLAMTRGQNGLMMDERDDDSLHSGAVELTGPLESFVVPASADEAAAHAALLATMAKETRKPVVWGAA